MHACRAARVVSRVTSLQPGQAPWHYAATMGYTLPRISPYRRPFSSQELIDDGEDEITGTTSASKASTRTQGASKRKTPRRKRERPAILTLTDRAALHVAELLASKPDKAGVRLGIKRRGCNGLSYTMKYTDEKPNGDEEVVVPVKEPQGKDGANGSSDGAVSGTAPRTAREVDRSSKGDGGSARELRTTGAIDSSRSLEDGTVKKAVLFVDPMATFYIAGTVMDWEETELSAEFTFRNPNAKGECGCGESFNV